MNEAIDILTFLGIPGDKIQRYQVIDNEEIMPHMDFLYLKGWEKESFISIETGTNNYHIKRIGISVFQPFYFSF